MAYKAEDFKVGDIVRFRDWDDMESEFGLRPGFGGEIIRCYLNFTKAMSHLCGTTATIRSKGLKIVHLTNFETHGKTGFNYSYDMIQPADSLRTYDFSEEEFFSIIS